MDLQIIYGLKEFAFADGGGGTSVDITSAVVKDGFPKHYEQQLKGKGYFDYSVKEFSFKIIKSRFNEIMHPIRNDLNVAPEGMTATTDFELRAKRFDHIKIKDRLTGELITRGFVDEISDWMTSTPTLKIFPDAVRLKDVMVGDEITDEDGDDPFYIYDTGGVLGINVIIAQLCTNINERLGGNEGLSKPFSVNPNSCPPPPNQPQSKWLGSVLHKRPAQGFSWNLAKMFINAFDGSFIRRRADENSPNGYEYNFEERDASIIKRILIHMGQWLYIGEGQWIDWRFVIPTGIHLTTWNISFHIPDSITFTTAWFDIYYPTGISFTMFTLAFSYPNGISISWSYAWGIPYPTVHISFTTFSVDVGEIIPQVNFNSFTVDLGHIQPHIHSTLVEWDLGHILPALEWGSKSFTVPNSDINVPSAHIYIPCIGSEHQIYNLSGGGIEHMEGYVRSIFPLVDTQYYVSGLDNAEDDEGAVPSLNAIYGARFDNSGACENVPISKVNSFLKNDEDTTAIIHRVAVDWDNQNSYFISKVRKGVAGSDWLMSFETPFDFSQKVKYKNKKANEVLKQLSIMTNRYFFVDSENVIHLKPRVGVEYTPQQDIERRFFLKRTVKVKSNENVEIKVDRLKEDSEGKVQEYGVYMRDSEFEYLQRFYADIFSGDVVTNEFEIVRPTEIGLDSDFYYPKLMDMIYMSNDGTQTKLGVCFEVGHGTEQSTSKYVTQFIRQGDA